jgi:predicted ATP-binding protein involved in virulence
MDIKVTRLHAKVLDFLLKWRVSNPNFTFTLRKSDINERLSQRYWFHGNDEYIAISFWTGVDWQRKIPNLSFVIDMKNERTFFQVSCRDSPNKEKLLKKMILSKRFTKLRNSLYVTEEYYERNPQYINSLESFLNGQKIWIDDQIRKYSRKIDGFDLKRNTVDFINEKQFKLDLKKIDYYRKVTRKHLDSVQLASIAIKNFGPIKKIHIKDIPQTCKWIFFTGENGAGKTNILRAISIGLVGRKKLGIGYPQASIIKVGLKINGKKLTTLVKSVLLKNNSSHKLVVNLTKNTSRNRISKIPSKGFVAFGPMRLNVHDEVFSASRTLRFVNESFKYPEEQLFSTTTPLVDLGYIYNRRSDLSRNLKSSEARLRNIVDAITTICESIIDIQFKKTIEYFEEFSLRGEHSGLQFKHLASGYRSIIAMISHLMLHLFNQQPEVEDPAELEGVVIIDEIDLHFHPKMQRDLVIKLSEIFPRVQFIVSTHSPIPLLGAPRNSLIFRVYRNSKIGVWVDRMDHKVLYDQILPNAILTSPIFGLENIAPHAHKQQNPLRTEDSYSEIEFNDRIKLELSNYMSDKKEKDLIKLFKKKN